MTENEKNSPVNHTTTSCTSSTDSGVIIIDNTATFNEVNGTTTSIPKATTTSTATDKPPHRTKEANDDCCNDADTTKTNNTTQHSKNSATNININNYINITKTKTPTGGNETLYNGKTFNNNDTTASSKPSSKNVSPTASIRSTSISIVSIDENAVDSSVVDSDSDFEDDAEGVHSKYIVKKLGQQTTYPPNSPDIPNINKGLTVLSHQILPNGGSHAEVPPFANNILKGNLGQAPSNAPQIGSIALTNSTDVTFGDKHYYPGPVTIQQFLIDNRNGQDNPSFDGDTKQSSSADLNGSQKINIPQAQPTPEPYKFIFNRKAIILTSIIIALTILSGILFIVFKPTNSKNDDNGFDIETPFNGTLQLVQRDEWSARPPKMNLDKLKLPVHRVIIAHTATEICNTSKICEDRMRNMQSYHMDSYGWDDIGYNFAIGGDGRVYIARGWNFQGAHTKGYNTDSIGIAFIGTFNTIKPTEAQVESAKLLIDEGVRLKKLVENYRVYGARQMGSTESPGDALYRIIRTWPHWSSNLQLHK